MSLQTTKFKSINLKYNNPTNHIMKNENNIAWTIELEEIETSQDD
jgi:hypothetical protein